MPQVGTLPIRVSFTPSPSLDVVRHTVQIASNWWSGGEGVVLIGEAPVGTNQVDLVVPQHDNQTDFVAIVKAWDAADPTSFSSISVQSASVIVPAGDAPPEPPSGVTVEFL